MIEELSKREIANIDDKKLKRIERYNESYEKRESAEARKEFCKQLRFIFEKAPPETIPFLVYCIYVAAFGIFGIIYVLINYQDTLLYISLGVIIFAMILPLISLPRLKMGVLFSWMKSYQKAKKENNLGPRKN